RESPIPQWRRVVSVVILTLLSLFMMFDRYVTAGILPRLESYYSISNTWGGLLQTGYIVVYVVCLLVVGAIGDRMSRKRIILVSTLFWIVFMIASSFIPSNMFWLFITIRSLTSIGLAAVNALAPSLFADYFTGAARGSSLMIFYMSLPVGSSSSIAFGSSLVQSDYFLWALRLCPIIAILLLFLSIFLLEEPIRGGLEEASQANTTSVKHDLFSIFRVKSFWLAVMPTLLFNFYLGAFSWWSATLIGSAINSTNNDPAIYHGVEFGSWMGISSACVCVASILGSMIFVNFSEMWRDGKFCFTKSQRAPALTVGFLLLIDKEMISAIVSDLLMKSLYCHSQALTSLGTLLSAGIMPLDTEIVLMVITSTRRAAALSIMNILMCITGDGPAPFIVGLITDLFLGGSTDSADLFNALRKTLLICQAISTTSFVFALANAIVLPSEIIR
ncbi:hypothetical protein PMAYCL1PPCAC_28279, partial [Pristionchus mayeri]